MSVPGAASDPMIGRDELMERVRAAVGAGRSVIVSGPPGVGKSRLLRELAAEDPAAAFVTASSASLAVPFGVFVALAPLSPARPVQVAAEIRARLLACGRVLVDDGQLLDPSSAGLLLDAARAGAAIVLTARDGEPLPLAIRALVRDGAAEIAQVGELDRDKVRMLLESLVHRPVSLASAARIHRRWGGNPLLIRLGVRQLRREDPQPQSTVEWEPPAVLPIVSDLAEVMSERISDVAPNVRLVLELAAVADPLRTELAESIAGPPTVDEAIDARLVVADGRVLRVAHPLLREVVLGSIPESRRRRRYAELAAASETLEDGDGINPVQRVAWRIGARAPVAVAEILDAAAVNIAGDIQAWTGLMEAAADRITGPEDAIAVAMMLLHRHRDRWADEVLDRWLSGPVPDDVLRPALLARSLGPALIGPDPDRALTILDDADPVLGRDPFIQAHRATAMWRLGRLREARALARSVRDDGDAPAPARIHAGMTALSASVGIGDVDDDERAVSALLGSHSRELPGAVEAAELTSTLATISARQDPRTALATARDGLEAALRRGDEEQAKLWLFLQAIATTMTGDPAAATALFREAEPNGGVWSEATGATVRGRRIRALVLVGELAEADEVAREFVGHPYPPYLEAEYEVALCLIAASRGDRDGAASRLIASGDRCASRSDHVAAEECWFLAMVLGSTVGAERLSSRARLATPAALARVACARGMLDRSAAEVERAAIRFEELGHGWCAVEAQTLAANLADESEATAYARRLRSRRLMRRRLIPLAMTPPTPIPLTAREREIARHALRGLSDREIAAELGVSVRTVNTHLGRTYSKLGIRSRRDLVVRDD